MRALLICFIASLCISACATDTSARGDYRLYLVRHAEKVADDSRDPNLTATGMARSSQLAERLRNNDIRAIWSSDYQRTRGTAAPLAKQRRLKVMMYDPDQPNELQTQLEKRHENALIVGHSNTIPELARILCNCEVANMEETEYDRLIVIKVHNGKTEVQTLIQ